MVVKSNKTRSDDLSYWNVKQSFNKNEIENVDDEERSIALSVNLLLKNKNISEPNLVRLPSHLVTSPTCQCCRSFHIFCTDLFTEHDENIDMIHIHPAPLNHERDLSRRISTPYRKYQHQHLHQEDNDQDAIITARSEPSQEIIPESQLIEKKLRIPPKLPPRTTSLNIPSSFHSFQRSIQTSIKYHPSIRLSKPATSTTQLQIRALSVFDQSPTTSRLFTPRGPPPSPKTPTRESSMVLVNSVNSSPFRAISITPRVKNSTENEKKLTNTPSIKTINYEDHAREYLSDSDCSDNDNIGDNDHDVGIDEEDEDDDKDQNKVLMIAKPKAPVRKQSLSRPGTALRDRVLPNNTKRYLSLAEIYYSSLDVYKNLTDKSHRLLKAQTRLMASTNENDDALTNITKTTTKTAPVSQSKSVFGFSKTASSMHFGHAAGRLGLQGSFEKWPQPLSRRTPIERKQEVTALRLVTLPLVTS